MTASRTLGRANRRPLLLLSAVLWIIALVAPTYAADQISVPLDKARILHLPDRAATIVIGNPLIADLSIQPGGLAVITGKSYGETNFVVLDRGGIVLAEKTVEVTFPNEQSAVVVYRGADRETYSCTPDCSRRLTLGDSPDIFDKVMTQITSRNTQSASAGSVTGGR
jgi:Pilus formation protein N terminal region